MYNKKVEESKIYDTWLIKVNAVLLLHFMHALSLRCTFAAFLILFFNAPHSNKLLTVVWPAVDYDLKVSDF